MAEHILSLEAQAVLLLAGTFGERAASVRPLTTSEFNKFQRALAADGKTPDNLLELSAEELASIVSACGQDADRIVALLSRGGALALAIEQWTNVGLWVMTRGDANYPSRLKTRLGENAPLILYGAGDTRLLERGGVAIVGSRDADEDALNFTQKLGERCAEQSIQVVSGGARGVDGAAMRAAFEAGGTVIGVLAEGLAKEMVAEKYRAALREERLTLVSPFHPRSVFSPGSAMERNKYIYALADFAVVVSSDFEKGGTWTGAVEDLRYGWTPLFVRAGEGVPIGNQRLLKRGVTPIPVDLLNGRIELQSWFEEHIPKTANEQSSLNFGELDDSTESAGRDTTFALHWPQLRDALTAEKTEQELANELNSPRTVIRGWLKQAVEAGRVEKLKGPVRYVAVEITNSRGKS